MEIVSHRDECDQNTKCHIDGVSNVQILYVYHILELNAGKEKVRTHSFDASLCDTLRVRTTIQGLYSKRGKCRQIWAKECLKMMVLALSMLRVIGGPEDQLFERIGR